MKVAIIGAGVSGLTSARRALQYGLEIVVFEKRDCIGGIWVYDEEPIEGSSPIYANLRTNLPVQLMEFPGYEFKAESGLCYPPHSDVLKYINDFADHFDLRKFIRFQSSVVNVERLENEWRVSVKDTTLSKSSPVQQYLFDAVMVCNGHYSIPYVPYLPGQETFTGELTHSRSYRRSTPFKGRRLLIVGSGRSGTDIALECCNVATEVTLSCRCDKTQVVMSGADLNIKPQIRQIEHDRVYFVDDTSICVDNILLCTGYQNDVSFVDDSCGLKIPHGNVIEPLFNGFIDIMQPSMCFIGMQQRAFIFPLVDLQAEVFVKHLCGLIQLPDRSAMLTSLNEEKKLKEEAGLPNSHYFRLRDEKEYCTSLSRLGDVKPLAPVLYKIYRRNKIRLQEPKKMFLKFEIIDDDNFVCCEENPLLPNEQS